MKRFQTSCTITTVNTIAFAVAEMVEKQKSDDKTLNLFGSKIKEKADAQSIAIKKDRVYSGLDVLDSQRDTLWKTTIDIVSAYKKNPVETLSQAAILIYPIVEKYGKKITRVAYDEETAYLKSAQTDLSAPNVAEAVKVLPGLDETLEKLWAKNAEFEGQTASFVSQNAIDEKNATILKKDLVSLINSLVSYVEAVGAVRDDLKEFGKELEARIERANAHCKSHPRRRYRYGRYLKN